MKGYVYQRGRTWTYVVDIANSGKRQQKSKGGFHLKKDAEAALRKFLIEIEEERYIEPSKETFSVYIEYWFNSHYKKRIKITTIANRKYLMEKHLIEENPFSHKPLANITSEDIDALYNQKIDEDYSTSYIRKMHQMLNQAFQQAIKWKKIKTNPVLDVDPPSIKKAEMIIWDFSDINRFLKQCRGERHYITFLLAIYTGMRRGEILGLKWTDIDFKNKVIQVERSLAFVPNKGNILTTLKTKNARRKIPIPNNVVVDLLKVKKSQDEWKTRFGILYKDHDLVICTETGTSQDTRNVLRVMKRIIKECGVPNIRFHDIRHTHASILISEGTDIVKVAYRLGHANPKITLEYYAHSIPNADNMIAEVFHNAIEKSR